MCSVTGAVGSIAGWLDDWYYVYINDILVNLKQLQNIIVTVHLV